MRKQIEKIDLYKFYPYIIDNQRVLEQDARDIENKLNELIEAVNSLLDQTNKV